MALAGSGRHRRVWCWPAVLALAACGGGGGGGSGSGAVPFADSASYETTEYRANYGLAAINATAAYVGGATGRGVTVAVIDTGIDVEHPEFAGAIHPAATNMVAGDPALLDDASGHGTAVAGIIAARRNGRATHGVAFDGTLLPIRADKAGSCPQACSFTQSAIAEATAYAVAAGAQVINYSLGGASSLGASLRAALAEAAQDAVLVFAAGNDAADDPTYPARFAGEADAAGAAIAVGAVDEGNTLAAFSNRAGAALDAFLVAPGTNIMAPAPGSGSAARNGTSFSTPHVAGAAAVVLDAAPHMSARQVVELLLATATDLGAPGTDPVYGRGLVNLTAALRPQAPLSVPTGATVDGPAAALGATRLRSGAAFGAALRRAPGLRDAVLLDRYGRPYAVDLSRRVSPGPEAADLRRWLAASARTRAATGAAGALGFSLVTAPGAGPFTAEEEPWREGEAERILGFASTARLDGATRLTLGRGHALGAAFGAGALDDAGAFGEPLGGDALSAPFAAFVDGGDALTIERDLAGGFGLRLGIASNMAASGRRGGPDARRRVHLAEVSHRLAGGAEFRVRIGELRERRSLLDAAGDGALALGAGARTRFVGLSGRLPVSRRVDLLGQMAFGRTAPKDGPGSNGVVREISGLRSTAFGAGVAVRDAIRTGDRLGFVLSRPLKVVAGEATLDVPVGRTLDGRVVRRAERASLVPEGNEIDLELSYELDLRARGTVGLNLLTRFEPGHDGETEPAVVAGLRYRLRF